MAYMRYSYAVARKNQRKMCNFNVDFSNPDPHTGEGLRHPFPDPTPSAIRRFAPRLAQDLQSLHRRVPLIKILAVCLDMGRGSVA